MLFWQREIIQEKLTPQSLYGAAQWNQFPRFQNLTRRLVVAPDRFGFTQKLCSGASSLLAEAKNCTTIRVMIDIVNVRYHRGMNVLRLPQATTRTCTDKEHALL